MNYDAIIVISFGGPESRDEVLPFLENVLRGKNVPRERMLAVAEHYFHFDGKSPINAQNRALIAALEAELAHHGPNLPVYWGNRNWDPLLADTLRQMKADGVQRALAFVTSAYSSYSGCRQYRENIMAAQAEIGEGAPQIDKLRVFYNHPSFIQVMAERVREAFAQLPEEVRAHAQLIFTAHSIPLSMAEGCDYVKQLQEACRLTAERLTSEGIISAEDHRLVYQSRSGPPTQTWLEPDILDYLTELKQEGKKSAAVIAPIGFISDHMEVLYDLDTEARALCAELKLPMARAATAGTHPKFVSMIRELIVERMTPGSDRRAIGKFPANHDVCPEGCCKAPQIGRPPATVAIR